MTYHHTVGLGYDLPLYSRFRCARESKTETDWMPFLLGYSLQWCVDLRGNLFTLSDNFSLDLILSRIIGRLALIDASLFRRHTLDDQGSDVILVTNLHVRCGEQLQIIPKKVV